jgi:hypothetical protein
MSLRKKITETIFGFKGKTPSLSPGADRRSTLHYTSSINGVPPISRKPSLLDLNGKTPKTYKDNLPEEDARA